MGMVLMTKADPLEKPCARKLACPVLQTSGGSDPFAEFNNSHQPTRQRERRMQRFKSPGHAQRFLSAYGPIAQHLRLRRYRFSSPAIGKSYGHDFRSGTKSRLQP
jgi:transposase-like protein